MTTLYAWDGCKAEYSMGQKRPRRCEHGALFQTAKKPKAHKQGSTLKRTRREETPWERAARLYFNEIVKSWPCWFSWHRSCERCGGFGRIPDRCDGTGWARHHGAERRCFDCRECKGGATEVSRTCPECGGDGKHHCSGPKDAHHLLPKSFLRQRFQAVLPEGDFVAILFNPKIGAPLCRKAHEAIESGADRIYFEDLSEECLEYVGSLPDFVLVRLENECPKRSVDHRAEVEGVGS